MENYEERITHDGEDYTVKVSKADNWSSVDEPKEIVTSFYGDVEGFAVLRDGSLMFPSEEEVEELEIRRHNEGCDTHVLKFEGKKVGVIVVTPLDKEKMAHFGDNEMDIQSVFSELDALYKKYFELDYYNTEILFGDNVVFEGVSYPTFDVALSDAVEVIENKCFDVQMSNNLV